MSCMSFAYDLCIEQQTLLYFDKLRIKRLIIGPPLSPLQTNVFLLLSYSGPSHPEVWSCCLTSSKEEEILSLSFSVVTIRMVAFTTLWICL